MIRRFAQEEQGSTAVEYALVASMIAMVIVAGIRALSDNTIALYESISEGVANGPPTSP